MAGIEVIEIESIELNVSEDDAIQLFDKLTTTQLGYIQQWFLVERTKSLNRNQLRKVLEVIGKLTFTAEEFEIMFQKMDFEGNNLVSWDEFISYLILNFEHKEVPKKYVSLENPIPNSGRIIKSKHRHPVQRILFNPTVHADRNISWSDGCIMTCSHDGTINYWSMDMTYERSVKSSCPYLKIQQTYVTDMVALPDVSVVCTSSTERDLRFYDTSARKFDLRVIFTAIAHPIMCMTYYFEKDIGKDSMLVMGDTGGNIHIMYIKSGNRGPFQSRLGRPLLEMLYTDIMKGKSEFFTVTIREKQHFEYVNKIMYYPALNRVISASPCIKVGIQMCDLQEDGRRYIYHTDKGVWCFDITEKILVLATGGSDCLIRLWNPFVVNYPTGVLYGHRGGIISLQLQDNGKLLYSLSEDKCIKIWDLSTQKCLQNFLDLPSDLGEYNAMTTLYNEDSRQWIIGCIKIAIISLSPKQDPDHTDGSTHTSGVSLVLYNPLFKLVVTCGLDSNIIVWDPWDGRRLVAIREAHTMILYAEIIPIEITAGTFDPNYQRLITGARDGSIRIWNFNSGTCLKNLKLEENFEIKTIIWVKERILTMGWNKRVTEFADLIEQTRSDTQFCKQWDKRHVENISAAAVRVPETLVTCTYDGDMIMWKLETGQPYKKYSVVDPTKRIKIQYKLSKPKAAPTIPVKDRTASVTALSIKSASPKFSTRLSQKVKLKKDALYADAPQDTFLPLRKLAVHCAYFLKTRKTTPECGTLFVSLENGMVQVWAHHQSGGFITSFYAVHENDDYVLSMTSDKNEEYLFTGTIHGYVKTWFIKNYCLPPSEMVTVSIPKLRIKFPFMWGQLFIGRAHRAVRDQPLPILCNSYRGHVQPITSLSYIDESEILISGSIDHSARMWTIGGRYIQTIGTFKSWENVKRNTPIVEQNFKHTIPPEIRRCASSTTFRVLNGGIAPSRVWNRSKLQDAFDKELQQVDSSKIYGHRLHDPILGNYYKPVTRTELIPDVTFDTSFPYIPVYQHLLMPPVEAVGLDNITPLKSEESKNVISENQ